MDKAGINSALLLVSFIENNNVEVKISFLDENQNEVYDKELFEPQSDNPVELQIY